MTPEEQKVCNEVREKLGWLVNELYKALGIAIENRSSPTAIGIQFRISELAEADRHVAAAMRK